MRESAYTKRIMRVVGQGENILRSMEQRRRTTLASTLASRSTRHLYGAVVRNTTRINNGRDRPSSSSPTKGRSSVLRNLSHSSRPFSVRRLSGIHARRYVEVSASWINVRQERDLIEGMLCARVSRWPRIQEYCRGRRQLG